MIVCHRCGKENQNHYKFCLGCGAELTGASRSSANELGMMKTVMANTGQSSATPPGGGARPPGATGPRTAAPAPGSMPAGPPPGVPAGSAAPLAQSMEENTDVGSGPTKMPRGLGGWGRPQAMEPPVGVPDIMPRPAAPPARPSPTPSSAGAMRTCPECAASVPPAFRFCGVCGHKMPEESTPQAMRPAPQVKPHERAHALITLIRPDGSEGGTHQFVDGENKIGRNYGELFENDGYLSPAHATLTIDPARGRAVIRDLDSLNGVFVKMTEEEEIQSGQIIRIGQELLRFDTLEPPEPLADGTEVMGSPNPGYWGKITVIIGRGVDGSAYPLLGDSVTLGRERGEINFPDDGYVSGLHARITNQSGRIVLADLGSSNGSFIKVKGERELSHNSFVLLGQQLFRLSLQ